MAARPTGEHRDVEYGWGTFDKVRICTCCKTEVQLRSWTGGTFMSHDQLSPRHGLRTRQRMQRHIRCSTWVEAPRKPCSSQRMQIMRKQHSRTGSTRHQHRHLVMPCKYYRQSYSITNSVPARRQEPGTTCNVHGHLYTFKSA